MINKKALYKKAQAEYYAGHPIMTDSEFDEFESDLKKDYPKWNGFKRAGSERIGKKQKVKLPEFMPSLNKAYPHAIGKWLVKHPNNWVSNKLDGSSVFVEYQDGKLHSIITRGNGTIGQDISFLALHTTLPTNIATKRTIRLRCEAIMKRRIFDKKYKDQAENARNLVAGILNRKLDSLDAKMLKDVDFVVLGVFGELPGKGQDFCKRFGFAFVKQKSVICTLDKLSSLLRQEKEDSIYDMDGLVLASNVPFSYDSEEKPDWAIAFKENAEDSEDLATVEKVIWQQSRRGRLIPKIQITPVHLSGVTIKYCTAHNAKWMVDRGIGKGTVVSIVRSGDVIPKIVDVVKRAKCQMPEVPYEWDGVHLVAMEETESSAAKAITFFMKTLGVEFLAMKTIESLIDSYPSVLHWAQLASKPEKKIASSLRKDGVGDKNSEKIAIELRKLHNVPMSKLMVASGCYDVGIGNRRIATIQKHVDLRKFILSNKWEVPELLDNVSGFGNATIDLLIDGNVHFRKFLNTYEKYCTVESRSFKSKNNNGSIQGMEIAWTGYRDKEQEAIVERNGGVVSSFKKRLNVLLYTESGKASSKLEKAEQYGIDTMTWERFAKKFKL